MNGPFVLVANVDFFAVLKALYRRRYNDFLLTPASQKLTAGNRRVLMTQWIGDAFDEALTVTNPAEGFHTLGYFYADDASFNPKIRDFDYTFDPMLNPIPSMPDPVQPPNPVVPVASKVLRQTSVADLFCRRVKITSLFFVMHP